MSDMDLEIAPYLALMVNKEGEDIYFHSGAKILIKGPFGFAWLGEQLQPGQVDHIFRSIASDKKIMEFEEHGEVDFSLGVPNLGRFRGSAFRQRGETSLVFRYVRNDIPTVEELGLPTVLNDLVMEKNGLVVVVGATGSGKSTSLAAMIDHRNTNAAGHILTLEDPIEYLHNHKRSVVAQREIGVDTESYSTGIRSAMRSAPNVILLGEIRDHETMEFGLKFANTGHLCLTTLHANNAVSALERMMTFFPPEDQANEVVRIAQNLRGIISQRLVPTIDGGKCAAMEVLVNTPRVQDLITKQDLTELRNTIEQGSKYQMRTFDQALIALYEKGTISAETAVEYSDSKNNVSLHIRLNKGDAFDNVDLELDEIDRR
ncbi:PilT/PilU family type 4a pilus ATPase [Congregibacter litoralis]|uniref:Pilus retraction protein PilT n=1 Tax=Congregibacter litoralis KT71 TaxID=314285 RepID=A4A7Z0_9GAMM|nr:PilT/PilU family type 4a pilus ATPase [Congregibacter litoralis]EAQ97785.1 pilus retraction protein PilT [Congregibacter litoralis KT71]